MNEGRFAVEVSWKDFQGNTGSGQAAPLTSDTGYFWFFNDTNVELVVKVLDARALNGRFWVFYGALSNVQYTLTVTDSANGQVKAYTNPLGTFGSVGDTSAFPTGTATVASSRTGQPGATLRLGGRFEFPAAASGMEPERQNELETELAAAPCPVQTTSLYLSGCRFRVSVSWKDFQGNTGSGQAVSLTPDTGYFWFFNAANVELVAKVLDARSLNGAFWVFYGALSNVEYEITVTDTITGQVKRYLNPAQHFGSTGDTAAFPPSPPPALSSEELIDADLKAGKITDEQAFVYRVYVAFGSPSLPAQYLSTVDGGIDGPIIKELPKRFATLSPQAQAAIRPYLIPPIYQGSWGDPALEKSVQSTREISASARAFPQAIATWGCADSAYSGRLPALLPGWAYKTTTHFKIWYRTFIDPTSIRALMYTTAQAEQAAGNIALVAENVWAKLTQLFGKVPLSDANEACNGGDGLIDIYIDAMKTTYGALTVAYPPGCAERPAWMWIGPQEILDPMTARDVFAHEFMHLIDFAYSKGTDCENYVWLGEAAGNWAVDYVYPDDQFEQTGPFGHFAPCYYGFDYAEPIEQTGYGGPGCNGYCDYVFLFYLAHKMAPQTIRSVFEYTQQFDSLYSLDHATGGLEKVWPDFVTAGWNDWQAGVADDFYKWDKLIQGRKLWFDTNDASATAGQYAKSTPIELKGLQQKTFEFPSPVFGVSNTIEPLAARYLYLKFSDDNARYIIFNNKPAQLAPEKPRLSIRALMKINGEWKPEEDWTNAPFKTFCRDARAERIEELVVMYSNSDPARPRESSVIRLDEGFSFVPSVDATNVGCWRWEGTASVTTDQVAGPVTVESATATVFDRFRFPGTNPEDVVGFDAFKSANLGTASYSIDGSLLGTGCTISGTASSPLQGDGELLADGGFILNFLHPDTRLNRVAIGSGSTNIPAVTETFTCPPNISTTTSYKDVHWLSWPEEGVSVSADGLSISGRWERTDGEGHKVSVWNFTAKRE